MIVEGVTFVYMDNLYNRNYIIFTNFYMSSFTGKKFWFTTVLQPPPQLSGQNTTVTNSTIICCVLILRKYINYIAIRPVSQQILSLQGFYNSCVVNIFLSMNFAKVMHYDSYGM